MSSPRMVVLLSPGPPDSGLKSGWEIETEQTNRVAPNDLLHRIRREMTEQLLRDLAGVRPGAVLVRVVTLEQRVVDTDTVEHVDAGRVLEEARVHLPVVIG